MIGDRSGLASRCAEIARQLAARSLRVVFAESCTAGLVSASLAAVPGISAWLCGSLVTYRDASKAQWLGVPPLELSRHGAVSEAVARLMATGALQVTPEAELAFSVTGHLGPGAPADQDGLVFVGCARRDPSTGLVQLVESRGWHLDEGDRVSRQHEAVRLVLDRVLEQLAATESPG